MGITFIKSKPLTKEELSQRFLITPEIGDLYVDKDWSKLVPFNSDEAAYTFACVGQYISPEDALKYGLAVEVKDATEIEEKDDDRQEPIEELNDKGEEGVIEKAVSETETENKEPVVVVTKQEPPKTKDLKPTKDKKIG
jgi:hypothetical protein